VAKARWKGCGITSERNNNNKKIIKIKIDKKDKTRSGDGAPLQTPQWIHFKALQFLRDVIEPGKTSGNNVFTLISTQNSKNHRLKKP